MQKIVSIPAVLQNVPNPVPRIPLPDWLENKRKQKANDHLQPKITDIFKGAEKATENDIEDLTVRVNNRPVEEPVTVLKDTSNAPDQVISRF